MVGRHEDRNHLEEHIIEGKKYVIENSAAVTIDFDVLVALNHGSDDASSYPFIQAVKPKYVDSVRAAMTTMPTREST